MNLRVVSFNIRCTDDPNDNSIKQRAPRLCKVISKYNPDLIGFQEYTPKWKPYIKKCFGNDYDIFNKYRTKFLNRESCPVLWKKDKFSCIKTGYFWLSDTPEEQSRGWDELFDCFRICEYVVLSELKTGLKFVFMNTHLGFGDNCQVKSAKLIYNYSKKISSYPTFVTGDFNLKPDSPGYIAMITNFTDSNIQNDRSVTYHGYNLPDVPQKHIDYCFCDSSIIPLSYAIIKDMSDGGYPSDHYGIMTELSVKRGAC